MSLSDFKSLLVKTRLCVKLSTFTQILAGKSTLVSHNTISAGLERIVGDLVDFCI